MVTREEHRSFESLLYVMDIIPLNESSGSRIMSEGLYGGKARNCGKILCIKSRTCKFRKKLPLDRPDLSLSCSNDKKVPSEKRSLNDLMPMKCQATKDLSSRV